MPAFDSDNKTIGGLKAIEEKVRLHRLNQEPEYIEAKARIAELEKELRCYKADDCEECEYVNREREVKDLQARIEAAVEIFPLCADRDSDIPFSDLLKILTGETGKGGG